MRRRREVGRASNLCRKLQSCGYALRNAVLKIGGIKTAEARKIGGERMTTLPNAIAYLEEPEVLNHMGF